MTPIPAPEASISNTKGCVKLGRANAGVGASACFNSWEVAVVLSDHLKASFFNKFVKGTPVTEKYFMTLQ